MQERSDDLAAVAVIAVFVLAVGVWCGAQLCAVVSVGHGIDVSVADALAAMLRLPTTPGRPGNAWPADMQRALSNAVAYWVCTLGVLAVGCCGLGWCWTRMGGWRVGTPRRQRLGVRVGARFASRRDLTPLIVREPTRGRFILGTVNGRLVATERRALANESNRLWLRARRRIGDRSAVAVIGPTRSGKTATVIAGVLDWDGPAILSSVQNDLFDATVKRRLQLGTVYVFDPLSTIPSLPAGVRRCGWSPLLNARTVTGAMESANLLMEAAPNQGVTNANYWSRKGEALLWPILHAAAVSGKTMADVVRWLALQDGSEPDPAQPDTPEAKENPQKEPDDLGGAIRKVFADAEEQGVIARLQAQHALAQFNGFWQLDSRTRSDIYSTSQTLVQPWEDPYVSYASSTAAGTPIHLAAIIEGNNTLYVVQPLKSAHRFAPLFGGLLGALLKDQAYEIAKRAGEPLPDLLCVIDEAGNTPLRWLPEVASTCAGIGVLLVTVWQSKAQIDAIYQAQAGPLLTNHGSKLIFAGVSDAETLDYIAMLGGDEEIPQRSTTADAQVAGHRRSIGDSTIHRRFLPSEVVRQARPGHAVLFHATLPPAQLRGRRAWTDKRLAALARGEGPIPPEAKVPEAILGALDVDPTPPTAVLEHLPGYTGTVKAKRDEAVSDRTPPLADPRRVKRHDHGIER